MPNLAEVTDGAQKELEPCGEARGTEEKMWHAQVTHWSVLWAICPVLMAHGQVKQTMVTQGSNPSWSRVWLSTREAV